MLADIKYAFRQLRRSPGFAMTAILTLSLGIGATTAIFTLVHEVLLRSLPVHDPSALVRVGDNEQCCENGGLPDYQEPIYDWSLFSYRQYEQFRDHTPGFSSLAAFESSDHEMAVRRTDSGDPAQPWYGEFVSGNSFTTLGLRPYAGRLLQPSDDVKGAAPVAVLSFQAWEQKLGRAPSAIGSSFTVDGQPVTIVGIAPPGFFSELLESDPARPLASHSTFADCQAHRRNPPRPRRPAMAQPDRPNRAGRECGCHTGADAGGTPAVP